MTGSDRVGVVHAERQRDDAKVQEMEDEAPESGRGQTGGICCLRSFLQLARMRWKEGGEGWEAE